MGVTLDRLLARLHANKAELLTFVERPEIPLYMNGSERDIRCHVIKRKIGRDTHSDDGRDCRDAYLGLMYTATKVDIAFWNYLGARLRIQPDTPVPYLPELIRCRTVRVLSCHFAADHVIHGFRAMHRLPSLLSPTATRLYTASRHDGQSRTI
jgi:transposase IS66 family protein